MQDRMTATYILMTVAAQHKREERSSILSLLLDRMKSSTYIDIPWNWRQNTSSCFLEFLRLQQYTRCKRAARLHQHPEEKVTTNFLVCIVLHWHNCAARVVRDPLFLLYLQSRTFILSPINCSTLPFLDKLSNSRVSPFLKSVFATEATFLEVLQHILYCYRFLPNPTSGIHTQIQVFTIFCIKKCKVFQSHYSSFIVKFSRKCEP